MDQKRTKKLTKNWPKNDQKWNKNWPKIDQKWTKNGPKKYLKSSSKQGRFLRMTDRTILIPLDDFISYKSLKT